MYGLVVELPAGDVHVYEPVPEAVKVSLKPAQMVAELGVIETEPYGVTVMVIVFVPVQPPFSPVTV
jgi:hypothetical protein